MQSDIQPQLRAVVDKMLAVRHDIHAHPEIGCHERRTAAPVARKLREWGIDTEERVGGLGVVGSLRGRRPGQGATALRTNMDALMITGPDKARPGANRPDTVRVIGSTASAALDVGQPL